MNLKTALMVSSVSIHTPHARGDPRPSKGWIHQARFNPRPSCEGRLVRPRLVGVGVVVSIHAPHARGDASVSALGVEPFVFQSTPLMRGATASHSSTLITSLRFNPRPSCEGRRQTLLHVQMRGRVSIHAPHARGDASRNPFPARPTSFNPRPSCEGRPEVGDEREPVCEFQSTPLMRGAT